MALKSDRLAIVKKLAEQKESAAAVKLERARHQLISEQNQQQQIENYYQEYLLESQKQTNISADSLIRMRGFTQRLSDSIQQVNRQIQDTESTLEKLQQEWIQLRQKRQVLEDLIEKAQQEEQYQLSKAEQSLLDELTTQNYARSVGQVSRD